jgi:tetraacyldisaccharide 4'-kinase
MRAPEFWTRTDGAAKLWAALLAPIGWIYGATVTWKMRHAVPFRPRSRVICVGNLTAGGTGKTPVAGLIAETLIAKGLRVFILLRGYGGHARRPTIVDLEQDSAADVGDEALILARSAPVIVARNRSEGAQLADKHKADVIVMDDGHQNFSVVKDLSLVVVDAETGFANGHVIPAGPLREPVMQGIARADAIILVGDGQPHLQGFSRAVLRARIKARRMVDLAGKRVVAFAGIGRPEKFFQSVRDAGAQIEHVQSFADHHRYTASEIARLASRARAAKAELITTEKDFVRLTPIEREGILTLPVCAEFEDKAALVTLLDRVISGGLAPAHA